MKTLVITGIETVTGSNLAVCLSKNYKVIGITQTSNEFQTIAGCEILPEFCEETDSIRNCLKQYQPERVIHCGIASVPTWQQDSSSCLDNDSIESARNWALVTSEMKVPLTVITSDGLFTGPWMFHAEDCESRCSSPDAQMLASLENAVLDVNEETLLVRTHAYGWKPEICSSGWIEAVIENLESDNPTSCSPTRYASPILVEDLAEKLVEAWKEELTGVYHISGAERVNPQSFVEKLAGCLDLPYPCSSKTESLTERPIGYGLGETSLNCSKFRRATGTGMPLLAEGLEKLKTQKTNGYLEKLNNCKASVQRERVA